MCLSEKTSSSALLGMHCSPLTLRRAGPWRGESIVFIICRNRIVMSKNWTQTFIFISYILLCFFLSLVLYKADLSITSIKDEWFVLSLNAHSCRRTSVWPLETSSEGRCTSLCWFQAQDSISRCRMGSVCLSIHLTRAPAGAVDSVTC